MASNSRRDLLLAALDAVGMSVWLSRGESGGFEICAWSDGAERLYGIQREEALGENYLDLFVNALERDQSAADCQKILNGQPFRNFIAEDIRKDGTPRKILTNCHRVWDDELHEWLQAEIGLDISDLGEESEELLRRIREVSLKQEDAARRMLLLDSIKQVTSAITSLHAQPDGLDGVLRVIADSVTALTGTPPATTVWRTGAGGTLDHYGRAERESDLPLEQERRAAAWVLDRGRSIFIDSKTRRRGLPKAVADMARVLRSAPLAILPMTFAEKTVGVIVVVLPLASSPRETIMWLPELREVLELFAQHAAIAVVTAEQIDDLRRQSEVIAENQERETRDKLTDDFVHRVRHVAAPIAAYADLLNEEIANLDPATQERLQPKVAVIKNRSTDFLERVREIASGLEATEFDVAALIEGKIRDLRATHPKLRADYRNETAGSARVKGIRPFVFSALENVLVNAVTAMDGEGRLRVTVDDGEDGIIVIAVADEGPGIPEADIDRVWDKTYTTKGAGHGYGLWRTRDVITSLHGNITISATGPTGTTFEIELPRSGERAQPKREPRASRSVPRRRRTPSRG